MPGDRLAHQVPSGFSCASSWIFILPPPLSHKASPAGHIRGHEERHAALASPWGALWSRDRPVNLWAVHYIFPGTAAVSGQGLAEPTFSKSLWKGKGAALRSPRPGLGCLLQLLALCPGWQSQRESGAAGGAMHTPSKQRRPKGCLFLPPQSAGEVGWGVLLYGHTIPAVTPVFDSDPLELLLGEGWECWAHHWPTHSG